MQRESYRTRRGAQMPLMQGNQVLVTVPVPPQHTVTSNVVQPRPNYGAMPTPGGAELVSDVSEKAEQ